MIERRCRHACIYSLNSSNNDNKHVQRVSCMRAQDQAFPCVELDNCFFHCQNTLNKNTWKDERTNSLYTHLTPTIPDSLQMRVHPSVAC